MQDAERRLGSWRPPAKPAPTDAPAGRQLHETTCAAPRRRVDGRESARKSRARSTCGSCCVKWRRDLSSKQGRAASAREYQISSDVLKRLAPTAPFLTFDAISALFPSTCHNSPLQLLQSLKSLCHIRPASVLSTCPRLALARNPACHLTHRPYARPLARFLDPSPLHDTVDICFSTPPDADPPLVRPPDPQSGFCHPILFVELAAGDGSFRPWRSRLPHQLVPAPVR